jgi:hypothetical protein
LTVLKHFSVQPTRRFTIAVTGGAGNEVSELADASFGALIESTQLVVVEHSMYANTIGVIWATGANGTGTVRFSTSGAPRNGRRSACALGHPGRYS